MNVGRQLTRVLGLAAMVITARTLGAQAEVARIVVEPMKVTMQAGQTVPLKITAFDAQGKEIANPAIRASGPRGSIRIADGKLTAMRAGSFTAIVTSAARGSTPITVEVPVLVTNPNLAKLEILPEPGALYVGTMLAHGVKGSHADSSVRLDLRVNWKSSDPSVATVDRFGNVAALKPGNVTISADAEGATARKDYRVLANPVTAITLDVKETTVSTGDVVHLNAIARRSNGQPVADAKVSWTYQYQPDDTTAAPGGPGIVDRAPDGTPLFAANAPGRYTLQAQVGSAFARTVLDVKPRDVKRRITVTGRGVVNTTATSDLWPWTGKDGRDYCLVGTWGGDGYALVFDITDMNNIVKTDSIRIDARTINDVTVSPDGRYGVLTREGASNRVNGVVILDLATPAHPRVASTFDEDLTGGVHNAFATNDYLYAISGGQKYIIIDVRDITKPKRVGEYRYPGARIHDLWVNNGIAYSAQGGIGAVIVDVGNGKYGGTPQNPKLINVFPINSGHEIYPYFQKATGKTYLFLGDEEMSRQGRVWEGTNYRATLGSPGGVAQTSGGYVHIIDATDPMNMKKVGRYHLEDYGSHDIIVEDDVLYQAYYDGGVRVVDVSGELLGNLAEQKREIAVFKSYDPKGHTANAPFVMNAMPWKGQVLFTDFNSGLWAAKLEPKPKVTP